MPVGRALASGAGTAGDGDRTLVVLTLLERGDLGETLLTKDPGGPLCIAVRLDECLLGIHHSGAGRVA